jgi:Putative glycosyl/glycerophosphate transferases involved in teichoic acid biosynthesis TagF/TagB/EpsJ/RodC
LRNLEVIIVDDGSTDRSGEIAQAWARRFPKTIKYIRQENRGLSGARNTGLDHATGEWVSFPDPDDILDRKWLHAFNKEIKRKHERPVLIVARPLYIFREREGVVKNNHPLAAQYKKRREINTSNLDNYILLNTASNFFHRRSIEGAGLRFDTSIKPAFEDAHFVNRLIASYPDRLIVALPKPPYIYRKRDAGTSLLDGSRVRSEWYYDQIKFGYLGLFQAVKQELGAVPRFAQRVVLYSLTWRFKHLLNHAGRAAFLTEEQRSRFLTLVHEVFSEIDADTIRTMNLGATTEEYKVAFLGIYKGEDRANDVVYIKQYDRETNELQVSYYASRADKHHVTIFVDGKPAEAFHCSKSTSTLFEEPFFTEHRFWVRVGPESQLLVTINGRPARFKAGTTILGYSTTLPTVVRSLTPAAAAKLPREAKELRAYAASDLMRARFDSCWVLMDRDDAADDNAEHLYRYLLRNGKADKAFFVLREESADWNRLKVEGFKLIPYGSRDHVAAVVNASVVISSHAADFVLWPAPKPWIADLVSYRFVFLQHGVIKHDVSHALGRRPMRLFITSAHGEFNSIANVSSNYLFSQREVRLTGLPRHDALLTKSRSEDLILIMPTWRKYLSVPNTAVSAMPAPVDGFVESPFARAWLGLLHDRRLKDVAHRHGKQIVFAPHPNLIPYLVQIEVPDWVKVVQPHEKTSYQDLFCQSAVLVTDYSSVAMEVAYIEKPVVYYQFDRKEFFASEHGYRPGYFDYHQHGFGPVAETEDQVLDAIQQALEGREDPIYAQRRESFFAFRDGRCCERVYNEILKILPDTGDQLKASAQGMQEAAE